MRVVVTGANRGIGAGLASAFRARGDDVIATSRQAIVGCELLDVTDPISHREFVERLPNKPLDLLVCNAGVYLDKGQSIDGGFSAETWAKTFAVNVAGVFQTVQSLLPNLSQADAPRIAIISSVMASSLRAPGGNYAYRSSKAAVTNLGRNLAQDLAAQNIAVGIYHPGWVRTEMGGAEADIDVDDAVSGLIQRFDALNIASTGEFRSYDGQTIDF